MSRALVVDDSRAIRGILTKILINNGFEVSQASDGAEALALLTADGREVALVCADYNMPVMNGIELLRCLRANPRFRQVPVLMITTETHFDSMSEAFNAGANEYVMKPFTSTMIVEKLRMLGLIAAEVL